LGGTRHRNVATILHVQLQRAFEAVDSLAQSLFFGVAHAGEFRQVRASGDHHAIGVHHLDRVFHRAPRLASTAIFNPMPRYRERLPDLAAA